ncbi:hypothetical protein GTS_26100 [Gandjariella thermophila]|uniref:Uncharacterized protein n=1 Tax=Gandjariella thermophila TaxID=1931992 RepID=A0A4D4JAK1_9PSEU|nr:hypothetical protein GTS_26100 [Gandjariella thermophila]
MHDYASSINVIVPDSRLPTDADLAGAGAQRPAIFRSRARMVPATRTARPIIAWEV